MTPSFSFIFGIDHSRDSTFVDGIFTLEKKKKKPEVNNHVIITQ